MASETRNAAMIVPCGRCGRDVRVGDVDDYGHCPRCAALPDAPANFVCDVCGVVAYVSDDHDPDCPHHPGPEDDADDDA